MGAPEERWEGAPHVMHAKASEQRSRGPPKIDLLGFTPRGPTRASESEASRERSKLVAVAAAAAPSGAIHARASKGGRRGEAALPPVASAPIRHSRQSERERAPEAKLQQPASRERSKMRATGLEPARVLPHGNLNPVRLPIPPRPRRRRLYEKRPLSRFPSFVPTGDLPRFGLHSELVTVPAVRAPRPTSSPDLLVRVRHPPSTPVTGNPSTHEKS